jgi:DNA transposition AAA+ family ATPase
MHKKQGRFIVIDGLGGLGKVGADEEIVYKYAKMRI